VVADAAAADEARVVLGCDEDVEEAEGASNENIEANMDLLLSEADDSAAFPWAADGDVDEAAAALLTADPAKVPNADMPTRALFLLSSASSLFRSRVFFRTLPIFSDVDSLSSFNASRSVSASMPLGFCIPDAVLSEVLSIQ
jgi:hypothetical protein